MTRKILVTYATRCGSTAEVAEAIAQELRQGDVQVDVSPIADVANLAPYEAVVIGSAIRVGNWLPEAVSFVKAHKAELEKVPTSYFTVCVTMKEDTPKNRQEVFGYLKPVRDILKPYEEGYFGGKIAADKLNLFERFMVWMVGEHEGDFRNWTAIRGWANSLRTHLHQA